MAAEHSSRRYPDIRAVRANLAALPLRDASVVASEWPDADLRVIPNAGHWPQFETPVVTDRYVRAFLRTPMNLLSFMSRDT